MRSGCVDHEGAIVVVIHEINRCVAIVRKFRDGDGGAFGRIDNAHRVERVPVHPDDILLIQRRGVAEMEEAIQAARHLDDIAKLPIGLGPDISFRCDHYA